MSERLAALAERSDSRLILSEYTALSGAERVFRAVWELEAEINNGGFDQYFFNSSGDLARAAIDGLRAIGANAMARIVADAVVAAKYDPEVTHDVRQAALDDLDEENLEKLDEFDQAFYAYPDDLTVLLYEYVSKHEAEFVLSD